MAPSVSRPFQLGVNLVSGVYWSGEQVFSNLATSDEWGKELAADEMGNIVLKAGQIGRRLLHPPVAVLNHTAKVDVTCTWTGAATARIDGLHRGTKAMVYKPNSITFEWNGLAPDAGINTWIDFTGPGEVKNLGCYEAGVDPRQLFSSEFLESVKPFSVLRSLDWGPANANPPEASLVWANRTKPGSIEQLANGHVAYEYLVDLSNINRSAPWFTVPYNGNAAYQRALAQMVHDRLDPGLPVYVELSNEVWNPTFGQNADSRREGKALGLDPGNEWGSGNLAYARKTSWLMDIWSDVFKDRPDKLVRIAGIQATIPWQTEYVLKDGGAAAHVDAVAIAPYFGYDLHNKVKGTDTREAKVAAMNKAVDEAIDVMQRQKIMADKYGKRLIAYEAGQHILSRDSLMADLNRDPAMYDAYKRYIAAWRDTFGDVMTLYNTTGRISEWGAWGMREYAGQPLSQTPKLRAALEFGRK